jgi:ligand-binding sensor domain-containing protein
LFLKIEAGEMRLLLAITLMAVSCALSVRADEWEHYTNGDNITAIAHRGDETWVGTVGGLVRLKNESTSIFTKANSAIPSNMVRALAIEKNGTLWVATLSGLGRLKDNSWTVFTTENSDLPTTSISKLAVDSSGKLWLGTDNYGLVRYDGTNWDDINTQSAPGMPGNDIQSLSVGPNGTIWVGTRMHGLGRFDGTTWTTFTKENSELPTNMVTDISFDAAGNTWITTFGDNGGLARFKSGDWKIYDTENSDLQTGNLMTVRADAENKIWVGTDGNGLGVLTTENSTESWEIFTKENSEIPSNAVYHIEITAGSWLQHVLVGTYDSGLALYNEINWSPISTSNSAMLTNGITAIASKNGQTWIGTDEKGVTHTNGTDWTRHTQQNSIFPNGYVSEIAIDAEGNPWVATVAGLAMYNGTNWSVYTKENSELPEDNITAVHFDVGGNLWIGTRESGLVRKSGETWTRINTGNSSLPRNDINAISVTTDGKVWVACAAHLYRLDGNSWTDMNLPQDDFQPAAVTTLAAEGNMMWVGTETKTNFYNGTEWITYGEEANLALKIIVDPASGAKWFAAMSGLHKFQNNQWTRWTSQNSPLIHTFTTALALDDKKLWIGSFAGLMSYEATTTSVDEKENPLPKSLRAHQQGDALKISFDVLKAERGPAPVKLTILNIAGEQIAVLKNESLTNGEYEIAATTQNLPSGAYFLYLKAGEQQEFLKVNIVR